MLIVANWKENPLSAKEAEAIISEMPQREDVVVCPPHPFLYLGEKVTLGAQDCSAKMEGSFTGEVSAGMLKSLGCRYVIIGHSERRALGEDKETVDKKIEMALSAEITPIVCISSVEEIPLEKKIIIAYEPLSAIGTGNAYPFSEAKKKRKEIGEDVTVLYGGSVDEENVSEYIDAGFDGVLVGGASLDPLKFNQIIKRCDQKN